jgi:replicative DNA helicase
VVIHQLNRESERRNDNHPVLADLRDSGNVEQDADTVCFVHREAYAAERAKFSEHEDELKRLAIIDATKNDMDLIIAKNRNGPCGVVELHVDMSCNAVRDRINMAKYSEENIRRAS